MDGRIIHGAKFISTDTPNQRSSELLLKFPLHCQFRVHIWFVLSTFIYHISSSWVIALRVLTSKEINPSPIHLNAQFTPEWFIWTTLYIYSNNIQYWFYLQIYIWRKVTRCKAALLVAALEPNAGGPAFGTKRLSLPDSWTPWRKIYFICTLRLVTVVSTLSSNDLKVGEFLK